MTLEAPHTPAEPTDNPLVPAAAPPKTRSRVGSWILRAGLLGALVAASVVGVRRYRKAHAPTPPAGLRVRRGDVVQKAQATGRIVPRQEVFVRPLVSGVLAELRVHPGDRVRRGDHLATVRIVADPVTLNDARSQVTLAQVALDRAERERVRAHDMASRELVAAQGLAQAEDDARAARAQLAAARERVALVERGSANAGAARSNRVTATVDGTVLAVPVNVGDFVSETGSFRDGTVIAAVADMTDLLFKGQIEEAYVGQLRLGMGVSVRVGALSGDALRGTLQWISPRATIEAGTGAVTNIPPGTVQTLSSSTAGVTRFELWAALGAPPGDIRAGYSASAEVELARREHVLLLEESALKFSDGKAFVQMCAGGREREVTVGVSDGVRIEVVSGLVEGDCVREREPQ